MAKKGTSGAGAAKGTRTYKQPSVVSGMTIDDIMNIDYDTFSQLSHADLKKVTSRLISAANKRIKRMEKAGMSTPAMRAVQRGGALSVKNKNLNQVRSEYIRARQFLGYETSSFKGWNAVVKETIKSLNNIGVNIDAEHFNELWELYEKMKEADHRVSDRQHKYNVLRELAYQIMHNDEEKTGDEIIADVQSRITELYEAHMEVENEFDGVSQFFKQ